MITAKACLDPTTRTLTNTWPPVVGNCTPTTETLTLNDYSLLPIYSLREDISPTVFIVDADDASRARAAKRNFIRQGGRRYVAIKAKNDQNEWRSLYLHTKIPLWNPDYFGPWPAWAEVVDHRFGDVLDNRRKNLRYFTKEENRQNVNKPKLYKGVFPQGRQFFGCLLFDEVEPLFTPLFNSPLGAALARWDIIEHANLTNLYAPDLPALIAYEKRRC